MKESDTRKIAQVKCHYRMTLHEPLNCRISMPNAWHKIFSITDNSVKLAQFAAVCKGTCFPFNKQHLEILLEIFCSATFISREHSCQRKFQEEQKIFIQLAIKIISISGHQVSPGGAYCEKPPQHFSYSYLLFLKTKKSTK